MDIDEVSPRQLAPSVGSIDTGDMDSPVLATSPVINSMIIVSQVRFGSIEFLPHPPSLLPVFENMDHGMDLPIGSLSFRVGSRGSICLSDPICSGPSAIDEAPIRATSSTDSSSKVNSPVEEEVNNNTASSWGDLANLFDDISSDNESESLSVSPSFSTEQSSFVNDPYDSFDYNSMEVSFDSEVVTNSCHREHHHVYAIITGDSGEGQKNLMISVTPSSILITYLGEESTKHDPKKAKLLQIEQ
jgi:hypothetical protein